MSSREIAKVLTQNGYTIGQGLFEIKHSTRSGNDGVQHIVNTPKVTPKGQQYFISELLHNVKSA